MSLPKCKDFTDYNKYPGEESPTTDAQMQEYMDNQNQLVKAASTMMWQPSTSYVIGDIVVSPSMPANTEGVCTKAGTSDSALEPSWSVGSIADGSCFWKVRYVHYTSYIATEAEAIEGTDTEKVMTPARVKEMVKRFSHSVGSVIACASNSVPDGYLLCNGAEISRTTYADLFAVIGTTYGTGDEATTFALPNLTDKFIMGSTTAGTVIEAGLPNIEGSFSAAGLGSYTAGAFTVTNRDLGGVKAGGYITDQANFSAQLSNAIYGNSDTVQPPAVTMRYCIKY